MADLLDIYSQPGVGTVSNAAPTTANTIASPRGINYGDIIKLLMSSGSAQQQQIPFGGMPSVQMQQPGQSVPVFNIQSQLPQQQKKQDSTGAVISALSTYFGL